MLKHLSLPAALGTAVLAHVISLAENIAIAFEPDLDAWEALPLPTLMADTVA